MMTAKIVLLYMNDLQIDLAYCHYWCTNIQQHFHVEASDLSCPCLRAPMDKAKNAKTRTDDKEIKFDNEVRQRRPKRKHLYTSLKLTLSAAARQYNLAEN